SYFFEQPQTYDLASVKPKWNDQKADFFKEYIDQLANLDDIQPEREEPAFKAFAEAKGLKIGDVMMPFRIMLVGSKFGPHVFDIVAL
ncbi:hypothetical protein ABTO49_21310, partial [Acinetobacter baumannii]